MVVRVRLGLRVQEDGRVNLSLSAGQHNYHHGKGQVVISTAALRRETLQQHMEVGLQEDLLAQYLPQQHQQPLQQQQPPLPTPQPEEKKCSQPQVHREGSAAQAAQGCVRTGRIDLPEEGEDAEGNVWQLIIDPDANQATYEGTGYLGVFEVDIKIKPTNLATLQLRPLPCNRTTRALRAISLASGYRAANRFARALSTPSRRPLGTLAFCLVYPCSRLMSAAAL